MFAPHLSVSPPPKLTFQPAARIMLWKKKKKIPSLLWARHDSHHPQCILQSVYLSHWNTDMVWITKWGGWTNFLLLTAQALATYITSSSYPSLLTSLQPLWPYLVALTYQAHFILKTSALSVSSSWKNFPSLHDSFFTIFDINPNIVFSVRSSRDPCLNCNPTLCQNHIPFKSLFCTYQT